MKIIIDNVYAQVVYEENTQFIKYFDHKLKEVLNPLDPNRFRVVAFRMHKWDGRVQLYNEKTHQFRIGLLYKVQDLIKQVTLESPSLIVTYEDLRDRPIRPELPDELELPKPNGKVMQINKHKDNPRAYQYISMEKAFEEQRMVVNGSTNSGKTAVSMAISLEALKELQPDERIFFVCESKQIFYQTQKNYEAALGIPIGLWGDNHKEFEQVTCVMVGTMARALKDPQDSIKLTRQKDKVLYHMVKDYLPRFIEVPNIKATIKSFLQHNKPKYSYDEEIFETLAGWVSDIHATNDLIRKAFGDEEKRYKELLVKKAGNNYHKYVEAKQILSEVKVVIVDECHHAVSNQYQDSLAQMPNARMVIGLTGTIPSEKDKVKRAKFEGIFGNVVYKTSNKYLIDNQISAKPLIKFIPITKPDSIDLATAVQALIPKNTPRSQTDLLAYQGTYRLGITENTYRNQIIADLTHKLKVTKTGTTLIVVNSIEHGEIIQQLLEAKGDTVAFLQGSSSSEEREDILNQVKAGTLDILIGTTILDEGMDLPNLKYLVYASAGKSTRQVLQRIGRVLRISPEKKSTIVFDFMDRTSKVLYNQAKKRKKLYTDEQFEIAD